MLVKRASFVSPALMAFVTFGIVGRGVKAGAACVDGNFLAAIGPNTALNASGTVYYGPTYQTFSSECDGNFVFSYNIYAEGLDTTELWNNSPIQISSCALEGGAGGKDMSVVNIFDHPPYTGVANVTDLVLMCSCDGGTGREYCAPS